MCYCIFNKLFVFGDWDVQDTDKCKLLPLKSFQALIFMVIKLIVIAILSGKRLRNVTQVHLTVVFVKTVIVTCTM